MTDGSRDRALADRALADRAVAALRGGDATGALAILRSMDAPPPRRLAQACNRAGERDGEIWLFGCHISEWQAGSVVAKFDPVRPRKLLLHKKQVRELTGAVTREGATIVPVEIRFNDKGRAKVLIALATGKKMHDKRADIAKRDWQRDKARLMRDKG